MTAAELLAGALALLAVGAPLTSAVGRLGRKSAATVAVGATALAAVLALLALGRGGSIWTLPVLTMSPAGLDLPGQVGAGGAVGVVAATVLLVTLAVQVYAAWYLANDDRYPRFAATVGLFAAAMLLLVISRDLILTLVGWEVMGWCSYLLIGHWSRRERARRAAFKAFLVTRLADVGFILGVIALIASAGTSDLRRVVEVAACTTDSCAAPSGSVTVAMTLLVIGVLGKSAQLPFQDWLTDAMEGPTPASALIHAATMVAAGTWVLAQLAPLFAVAPLAQWVLAISVAATMTYAAFAAFLQTDLKRLLAWSTISQIAVMLAPLAVADHADTGGEAAVGHLYGHAIFKALLFLTVGWLAVLAGGTSARALRGSAAGNVLGKAAWALGLAALAGLPVTVGGFSKEHVVAAASWAHGEAGPGLLQGIVTCALLLTIAMTAAYATRAFIVVTVPAPDADPGPGADADRAGVSHEDDVAHPDPIGLATKSVLGLLTGATIAGSLAFFVGPLTDTSFDIPLVLLSLSLIAVGVLVGTRLRPDDRLEPSRAMRWADGGFGADAAYVKVVGVPVLALARLVDFLDREVVDFYVRGSGWTTGLLSVGATRAHRRERVATNLVWIFVGLLAAAGVALWR